MNIVLNDHIVFDKVKDLEIDLPERLPEIPDDLYINRLSVVRSRMEEQNIDSIIIYADKEHFSNFRYLAGFEPRFEEGILIVHRNGPSYVLLGRECYGMHKLSKIDVNPLFYSSLSIPNNVRTFERLEDLLIEAKIEENQNIGVVGWKLLEDDIGQYSTKLFDVPSFIMSAIVNVAGEQNVFNVTSWFSNPDDGIRTINNADEIAFFEFGAAWASEGVKNILNKLEVGISEIELANHLPHLGLPLSCHPMVSSGSRASLGLVSPSSKKIELGDHFTTCFGLQGGLSCRAGYVANSIDDIPEGERDYIEKVVKPFYAVVASWYEQIGIGVTGNEMFEVVNSTFPSEEFGWTLNPGHLIADEEYLSSPFYRGSETTFKSGQIVQLDIIPSPESPYYSTNAEDGVVLADENLRNEIALKHPKVWERLEKRRKYMIEELGISLKPEVLPMSNLAGLLRPLLLNHEYGMKIKNQ
jgi:hypothetical protein